MVGQVADHLCSTQKVKGHPIDQLMGNQRHEAADDRFESRTLESWNRSEIMKPDHSLNSSATADVI